MKLVVVALVGFLIGWMVAVLSDDADAATTHQCRALAHRGVHNARIDENTEASAAAAGKFGAWLDADLRTSGDHIAFLMHDRTVDRTTDGHGRVEDHDAAWVRQLRTEPNASRVPTWQQYLVAADSTPVVAELKQDVDAWTDAEIKGVVRAARGYTVYLGGAPAMLKRINELAPRTSTYWRPDLRDTVTVAEATKRSVDLVLGVPASFTRPSVHRLRAHGFRVGSRISGTEEKWAAAYRKGIRIITTGRPKALNTWCDNQ